MKRTRSRTLKQEQDTDDIPLQAKKSKKTSQKPKEQIKHEDCDNIFTQEYNNYMTEIKDEICNNSYHTKPKYINKPCNTNDSVVKNLANVAKFIMISPLEIYYKIKYENFHKTSLEEDKCSICLFNFYEENMKSKSYDDIIKLNLEKKNDYDTVLLEKCSDHFFHLECLEQLMNNKECFKCPNCNQIYGTLTGDQPDGDMYATVSKSLHCAGYKKLPTIIIRYSFPDGDEYSGTTRECYLPDCKEGREVLALLKVAFDRRLTFTIGTSVTTGQKNTTVWNGIHHKTNIDGGAQYFGYPDPTYFNRVKLELAAKGVLEENIPKSIDSIVNELIPEETKKTGKKRK